MLRRAEGMVGRIWQGRATRRRWPIPRVELFVALTVGCFGDECVLYEIFDIVADWKRLPFVCQLLYFWGMIRICPLVRFSSR